MAISVLEFLELEFPERGILWRGWEPETLTIIDQKQMPALLFVADSNAPVWPFLRNIFRAMPKNARLRDLLHGSFPALFVKAGELPEVQKALGAGNNYHIAVFAPAGLTPLITFNVLNGKPLEVVDEIVSVLERLLKTWRP
jgi:hypothetical protein